MVDFGDMAKKAKNWVDEHEEQVDKGLDKAGDAVGKRFGHEDQIDKGVDKLQGFTGRHEGDGEHTAREDR